MLCRPCAPCDGTEAKTDAAQSNTYLQDEPMRSTPFSDVQVADTGKPGAEPALEERDEVQVEGGERYKGQWKGSQWHGKGCLTRPDGLRYEGEFCDGQAHGVGKSIAANG